MLNSVGSTNSLYNLMVVRSKRETAEVVSLTLQIPRSLRKIFSYKPGQFITLEFDINGQKHRRAYSISSCPEIDQDIQITVKKLPAGLVSNYIHQNVFPANRVMATPAAGNFFVEPHSCNSKVYYFFAAGSGITPIMSMIKTVLQNEPQSQVFLLYGNRSEEEIVFEKELQDLGVTFANRFKAFHILSRVRRERYLSLLETGLWWNMRRGHIDEYAMRWFFNKSPIDERAAEYFICGPEKMMKFVEGRLLLNGIKRENIHLERFVACEDSEAVASGGNASSQLYTMINGEKVKCMVRKNETLLEGLLAHKVNNVPYTCKIGLCGNCKVKLTAGKVRHDRDDGLSEQELKDGFILTCQAKALTKSVKIEY